MSEQQRTGLKPKQGRRIEALNAARKVMEVRGAATAFGGQSIEPPLVDDLLCVAQFILTGEVYNYVEKGRE